MVEMLLSLFDVVMNIFTWGYWGQSQGQKSSRVTRVKNFYEIKRK